MSAALGDDEVLRPPLDDLGFDDPAAWGYCDWCAFVVAVKDGLRRPHRFYRLGDEKKMCRGGGEPPVAPPVPAEARPRYIILWDKTYMRSRRRSIAFEQRRKARDEAATEAAREAERDRLRDAYRADRDREADCGE